MGKKVLVPIGDGVEEIEACCIIDCLRRAGADVTVASVGAIQITASRGVRIVADVLIGDCVGDVYDLIALPGGLPGADHLRDCEELIVMLKEQKDAGRLYAAICAAPAVVLQHHGLIEDKKATCYPSLLGQLSRPDDTGAKVVVDGNCITSQGPGTAIEFGIKLIEVLFGADKAKEIASGLLA